MQLSAEECDKWLKGKSESQCDTLETDWSFWERYDQRPPEGDWRVWLLMAGRGYGKTRVGAEWIRSYAEANPAAHIAIVGSTFAEARSIMIEGNSGLLTIAPDATRPLWEPSLHRLSWPGGAIGHVYSAAEPEQLRGPEHHMAWCDEIAKWDRGEAAWDNLMMTMRLGSDPRIAATTTPRPVPLMRRLLSEQGVALTRGTMQANRANVPTSWVNNMESLYGGTRLGRQELDGEMIDDVEHALWSRDLIEKRRIGIAPALKRTVIGVDPPAGVGGDACGIIVVGLGVDDNAYVLADASVSGKSPEGWARAVANACDIWNADRVIAEGNQGGAMVESTLRAASVMMPIKRVFASVGKVARAEPVAALYENGRAWHVGGFDALEDELCGLVIGGAYQGPGRSPDRADALVWAMSEVMLENARVPRVRGF
jgi:phage terminase large subunit-like protein